MQRLQLRAHVSLFHGNYDQLVKDETLAFPQILLSDVLTSKTWIDHKCIHKETFDTRLSCHHCESGDAEAVPP